MSETPPLPVSVVVFDMGGVLVELGPHTDLIGATALDAETFWSRWLASPAVRAFERGGCGAEEFGRAAVQELGLDSSPEEFIDRFLAWPKGLFPGAAELVSDLRSSTRVVLLSNTNALHWSGQPQADTITSMTDDAFLSFEMGVVKPDREIFDAVAMTLGVAPAELLFVDDNQVNVDGAVAAGWQAAVAKGPDQAATVIRAHGVAF